MKEIKLPELAVRSVYHDGYHAKVAFSKIKVDSVNYKILKAMEMLNKKSKDEKMVNILKYTKEAIVTQANLEKCFIDLCNKFKWRRHRKSYVEY